MSPIWGSYQIYAFFLFYLCFLIIICYTFIVGEKMKKNSLVEGTVVSYIMILITKLMGAIYVIPFYRIIGKTGGVLYSYAYNMYNLFLNISTSGIPTAVAILIAEYNTLKMYNEREYTYKLANKLIAIISFVSFFVMFVFAKQIGKFIIGDINGGNSLDDIAFVIRIISFCLLIIPFLSVTRGYLQGNKYISISSTSQLIEQTVRLIVVLLGSYIAINLLNLGVTKGVGFALAGAVVGGLSALLFLKYKQRKNKEVLLKNVTSIDDSKVSSKEIIKKLIFYSVPVIIISITQNIYEIIDQKFIIQGLYMIGYEAETCEFLSSIIITWAPKICMVITALAAGLCTSIIPFIVSSFVKKDYESLNKKYNQAINTILFIGMPLAAYLIFFARPVYEIFYVANEYGYIILRVLSIVSIIFSLQLVVNLILQGMKKYKLVYLNTIVGIIINTVLDIPLILLLNKFNFYPYIGSYISTIIGQGIALIIVFVALKKEYKFRYFSIFKTFFRSLASIVVMIVLSFILSRVLFKTNNNYIKIVHLAIAGIVTMASYLFISYKTGSLYEIMGKDFVDKILIKLKLKKKAEIDK